MGHLYHGKLLVITRGSVFGLPGFQVQLLLRCQPVKERLNADAWHRWWQITFLSIWGLSHMKELIAFRDFCHLNCTQECVCRVMWGEPLEPRDPNFGH